jgi:hypothetical protein
MVTVYLPYPHRHIIQKDGSITIRLYGDDLPVNVPPVQLSNLSEVGRFPASGRPVKDDLALQFPTFGVKYCHLYSAPIVFHCPDMHSDDSSPNEKSQGESKDRFLIENGGTFLDLSFF